MTLISIASSPYDLDFDIRYATANNFVGKPFYDEPYMLLHKEAAEKLSSTIAIAKHLGYRLKIFDAFRPLEAQELMWECYPDATYVSPPGKGITPHCRGIAVDLTLVDSQDHELDMGTEFDAFTPLSHHGSTEISQQAHMNRLVLLGVMTSSGWDYNPNEWWHYQLFDPLAYPVLKRNDIFNAT